MSKYMSSDELVRNADSATKPGRAQRMIETMDQVVSWVLTTEDHSQTFDPETTERVLIVTDTQVSTTVYHMMAGVLRTHGVETTITLMPELPNLSADLPAEVGGAMRETDLIINMASDAISHTEAVQTAVLEEGADYLILADPTEDAYVQGAYTADPQQVEDMTTAVYEKLVAGTHVKMTSPQGTDVELSLADVGEDGIHNAGYPNAEAGGCPQPLDEVNGTVVHDTYMMSVGLLDDPIRWEIEDGWITDIEGGREAAALKEYVDRYGDENTYHIAEFSIMTNPEARPNGNYLETKMVGGGVHMAMGSSTLMGGPTESALHLDGALLEPTVEIDGETITERGKFQIESGET